MLSTFNAKKPLFSGVMFTMILFMSSPNVLVSVSISHNHTIPFQNFVAVCEGGGTLVFLESVLECDYITKWSLVVNQGSLSLAGKMTKHINVSPPRGPSDHSVRDQVVDAATEHFGHFGYEKTTVSELAKSIGFSKSYIYKFFDSKQAIGEVICTNRLAMIMAIVNSAIADAPSASEKLRRLFRALTEAGSDLFFHDRKLYDIAAVAARDKWPSAEAHEERLRKLIEQIIVEGRQAGEFERKTPLDEAAHAIYLVMRPYISPVQLQYNLETAPAAAALLSSLILRSLSP